MAFCFINAHNVVFLELPIRTKRLLDIGRTGYRAKRPVTRRAGKCAIYLQVKAGQNLRLGLGVGCFLGSFLLCFICLLLTPIKLNPVRSIDLGKKIRTSRFKRYHRNNKGQGSCRLSSDSTITFSSPRRNRYGIRLYYMANSVSR